MLPKKILVATDASPHAEIAVETAIALAGRFGARVGVLHAVNVRLLEGPLITDISGAVGAVPFLNFQKQVRDALYHKGEAVIEAAMARCRERGIEAEAHLAEGVVSRIICRTAQAYDLVCLGRHGEHAAWSGLMLGSTVEEVVRGSSRPVLVTHQEFRPVHRLLLPYDGSRNAGAALALAAEMAAGFGAGLTVLHVSAEEGESEAVLNQARDFLADRPIEASFLHRPGDPVPVIREVSQDADLVVMGAYGHGRLSELFLGSTTTGVLSTCRRPVLLYR
jgi:nucleotide-binding universal stress UspA family protein